MPQISFDISSMNIPSDIILADENFSQSGPIDVLLGASIFFDILCVGQIKISKNGPILQKTKLGWIITGNISLPISAAIKCNVTVSNETLHEQLGNFFKVGKYNAKNPHLQEEIECETHFIRTHKRSTYTQLGCN